MQAKGAGETWAFARESLDTEARLQVSIFGHPLLHRRHARIAPEVQLQRPPSEADLHTWHGKGPDPASGDVSENQKVQRGLLKDDPQNQLECPDWI